MIPNLGQVEIGSGLNIQVGRTSMKFIEITDINIFFLNDPATTDISPLSLHDALPISPWSGSAGTPRPRRCPSRPSGSQTFGPSRSEEHTSELQSLRHLVCRLLLE